MKRLAALLGLEAGVVPSILQRVWLLGSAPITLLLLADHFTPAMQGYHYLFMSLLALQTFVELGFYLVIINIASHEWASLSLDPHGAPVGEARALSRLGSLKRLIVRWYSAAAALFVIGAGSIGHWFLTTSSPSGTEVAWAGPWSTLVLLTAGLLVTLPLMSLVEGCNQISSVNRFRLGQSVAATLALWGGLAGGLGLWSASLQAGVRLVMEITFLATSHHGLLAGLRPGSPEHAVDWWREVWPMQWRLALSGISNYFAVSLFSPVMFRYHGPEVAGRMGMTWSLVVVLQGLGTAWLQPRAPSFGIWLASGQHERLRREWTRVLGISLSAVAVAGALLCLLIAGLDQFRPDLARRVLPLGPVIALVLAMLVSHVSQAQSAFLRAHKQEPGMAVGVTTSLVIGAGVWYFGREHGPAGAAVTYLTVLFVGTLFLTRIWWSYWQKLHPEGPAAQAPAEGR